MKKNEGITIIAECESSKGELLTLNTPKNKENRPVTQEQIKFQLVNQQFFKMTGFDNEENNWEKPIFQITKELTDGQELTDKSTDSIEIFD